MFGILPPIYPDFPQKTKQGLDTLDVMLLFIPIIESRSFNKANKDIDKLKSWLVEKLKRGITPQENINLLQGLLEYVRSEPMTNEREKAMKYLFEAEFLEDLNETSKV